MNVSFKFSNIFGNVYKTGNVLFTSTDQLISPVGNRISKFDLKKYESETFDTESRKDIQTIVLSTNNRLLISIDSEGQCIVTSCETLKPIHHFRFKYPVNCGKYSPDGKYVAFGVGRRIEVYLAPKIEKELRPFIRKRKYASGFEGEVNCLSWSKCSSFLLAGCKDMNIRVFTIKKSLFLKNIIQLSGHKSKVIYTCFDDDNNNIFSISRDGTFIVWEYVPVENEECQQWNRISKHYYGINDGHITQAEYHQASKVLVTGFSHGVFTIHSLPEFSAIQQINISQNKITSIGINSSGEWLVFASRTLGQLLVWEWKSETFVMKQQGHLNDINSIAYSPDGRYLVSGGQDGKLKVWNVQNTFCFYTFEEHSDSITYVTFSGSNNTGNNFILTSSLDGTCRAFDLHRYRNFRTFVALEPTAFACVAVDPSSEIVAASTVDTFQIFLWSVVSGKLLDIINHHQNIVSCVKFLPSNKVEMITGSWDKSVCRWSVYDCQSPISSLHVSRDVVTLAVHESQNLVAVATFNAEIMIWDYEEDKIKGIITGRKDLGLLRKSEDKVTAETSLKGRFFTTMDISPDGKILLAAGMSKFICLYHLNSLSLVKKFQVTRNLSLDGVQERLNSRFMTENGPIDDEKIDSESENEENSKLKGSKDLRKKEIKVSSVCFSPGGRSFTASTTEGILKYGLEINHAFEPYVLNEEINLTLINEKLNKGEKGLALIYSLKMNEIDIIKNVMENFELEQVIQITNSIPTNYAELLIQHIAIILDNKTTYSHFFLFWLQHLLSNHSLKLKMNSVENFSKYFQLFNQIHTPILKIKESLLKLTSDNLDMLNFLTLNE